MKKRQLLLEAISYSAEVHEGQTRKNGKTPYASHSFRVSMILRDIFGIEDEEMLSAAVLHDVIEDTTKDFDDIEKNFSLKVAYWVAGLSKDKRQREDKREEDYFRQLSDATDEVKLIKLADIYDNLMDSVTAGDAVVAKILKKTDKYLDNFSGVENDDVLKAMELVRELKEEMEEVRDEN